MTPAAERAIEDALEHGRAILKFVSPNDVGITGSHQCGFYLPKSVWELYTPHAPTKGANAKSNPRVTWQDGRVTESCVTWYGVKSRAEYRLTRFGKDFPFLTEDSVGNLLVLIPVTHEDFLAYVLDSDEDIEEITSALGVEIYDKWGIYTGTERPPETVDQCIQRYFGKFVENLEDFPTTAEFSEQARVALENCIKQFLKLRADKKLMDLMKAEYDLFRMAERLICENDIHRIFKSVDDFLSTAASIMNRRKSRAGRSLENHFEYLLKAAGLPFEVRPKIDGEPDVILPGKKQYDDPTFPLENLVMVGVKTTCKDRWRQVLNEAKRIPHKHILTMQKGISANQLLQMHQANVTLIVPKELHKEYPAIEGMNIVSVESFLASAKIKTACRT